MNRQREGERVLKHRLSLHPILIFPKQTEEDDRQGNEGKFPHGVAVDQKPIGVRIICRKPFLPFRICAFGVWSCIATDA